MNCKKSQALNSIEAIEAELITLRKMALETQEPELIIAMAEWKKTLSGLLELVRPL